jgi:hypothetical protein
MNHERESANRRERRRLSTLPSRARLGAVRVYPFGPLCLLGVALGCDLVQGFQDAGDALFPEERTHLNAPGLRLVSGNYRDLRFASGDDLYLLARDPDAEDRNLYAMKYSQPRPCAIPRVEWFATTHLQGLSPAAMVYLEEPGVYKGTLRFADTNCMLYPQTVEGGQVIDGTPEGFVIFHDTTVSIARPSADPNQSIERVLRDDVEGVGARVFAGHHLAYSSGRLIVFSPEWRELGTFGKDVLRGGRAGSSLFIEDSTGIHRLTPDGTSIKDTVLSDDACELSTAEEPWVTYYSPCAERRLVMYHAPTEEKAPLDVPAHPLDIRVRPALGSPGTNPATQPFWIFYLRDVNVETRLGTLVLRAPDGSERELGSGATLDRLEWLETADDKYGYAIVDASGDTGTYRYFTASGETADLATGAVRYGERLIIDFDGTVGRLAAVSKDRLSVIAERVPVWGSEYRDRKDRWAAVFHEFDGHSGKLSILDGGLDAAEQAYVAAGVPDFPLKTVAPSVGYYRTAFLDFVLPGVIYIANHDPERDVGLLEYRNLELGFTAQISEGVADFVVTADDVLYTVPYGNAAGIWLLQAK